MGPSEGGADGKVVGSNKGFEVGARVGTIVSFTESGDGTTVG